MRWPLRNRLSPEFRNLTGPDPTLLQERTLEHRTDKVSQRQQVLDIQQANVDQYVETRHYRDRQGSPGSLEFRAVTRGQKKVSLSRYSPTSHASPPSGPRSGPAGVPTCRLHDDR